MKLQLLHGPAESTSRKKLIDLKQKFDSNSVRVFEEGFPIDEIIGSLNTTSLFPEEKLFILENPDENFIGYPQHTNPSGQNSNPYTLILWFDHELSPKKPLLEWVKKEKGEVLFFPEAREISVFPFLDLLAGGDNKAFLEINKLKNAGFDIFYFLTMTFYLLRNLTVTPLSAPQFVKEKLIRQRRNFPPEKIKKLYKDILEMEFKLKSGLLESKQAEFILVNEFIAD